MAKNEGGTAFPIQDQPGMTMRDYFAGQALAGLLANPIADKGLRQTGAELASSYAIVAYMHADAMIAERSK